MIDLIGFFALYGALCFVVSAVLVRFAPDSVSARIIRKRLPAMLALPVLLVVDAFTLAANLSAAAVRGLRRLFEVISGRKLRSRHAMYFSYGSQPRQRRRRT